MSPSPLTALLPLLDDLSRDLPQAERYRRLLQTFQASLPCDALALLRLDGDQLVPVAVLGLSTDTQEAFSHLAAATVKASERGTDVLRFNGLREAVDDYQRRLIGTLLQHNRGNLSATARALKIDRGNLHRLTRRLGLEGASPGGRSKN